MKKLKKSEFVIYAIALMLVTAGYFNYATFDKTTQETYSEDVQQMNEQYANTGDAVLVSNNEVENTENSTNKTQENIVQEENENPKQITEEEQNNTEDDYFASSKLDREKMYASMISNYEEILNNQNVTEAQKSIATQEITKINNTKNAIMISENLILTKGFQNVVIFVNEDSVNVVVKVQEKLTPDKVAIIQNIISRELGKNLENIHISEK